MSQLPINNDVFRLNNIIEPMRKKASLRWSEKEYLKGKRKLSDGNTYTVKEILDRVKNFVDVPYKIDIITPINDKYTEITNFWFQPDDEMALDKSYSNFVTIMKWHILILQKNGKLYKSVKRMWVLSRRMYKQTKKDVHKRNLLELTKLLQNRMGILYKIKAEAEALSILYEKTDCIKCNKNLKVIYNQIDGWKDRITYTMLANNKLKPIYNLIDNTNKNIKKPKTVILNLEKIIDICMNYLNIFVMKYMKDKNMYPMPKELMFKKGELENRMSKIVIK